MNTPPEHTLFEYFAGRATSLQKKMIEQWLKEPGNEEIFYAQLARWEEQSLQYTIDAESALESYRSFLKANESVVVPPATKRQSSVRLGYHTRKLGSLAASIVLVLGLGLYWARDYFLYKTYHTKYGNVEAFYLPDGSRVTMNANSTLKVSTHLETNTIREVWLTGEAFFSVAHRPAHNRFIVHTETMDIVVLGTKFNVVNRRGKTEVVLNEGKVKLLPTQNRAKKPLIMQPGDCATLALTDTVVNRKVVKPERYSAWRENKLVFEDTPLKEVVQMLNDYYGTRIVLKNTTLRNRQLTGTLPNDDLTVVLNSLSMTYHLQVVRENDRIFLDAAE
jgi:transmembrane sensor